RLAARYQQAAFDASPGRRSGADDAVDAAAPVGPVEVRAVDDHAEGLDAGGELRRAAGRGTGLRARLDRARDGAEVDVVGVDRDPEVAARALRPRGGRALIEDLAGAAVAAAADRAAEEALLPGGLVVLHAAREEDVGPVADDPADHADVGADEGAAVGAG